MIEVVRVNGQIEKFKSDNTYPTLEELTAVTGEPIQMVPLGEYKELWCHEEGKLIGLPVNKKATEIWELFYGKTDIIVGDVIICDTGDIK